MRRRVRLPSFLGTCAALSLLGFVGLCILWWRSDTHEDALQLGTLGGGAMWSIDSRGDRMEVLRVGDWPTREGPGVQTSSDDRPAAMSLVYVNAPGVEWEGLGLSVVRGAGMLPLASDGTPWRHKRSDSPGDAPRRKLCPVLRVEFPHWLPMLPTAVFPLAWAARRAGQNSKRLSRSRAGQCLECGHDLRVATAGRCPDCGSPSATPQPRRG
jgi:hypothetical protein